MQDVQKLKGEALHEMRGGDKSMRDEAIEKPVSWSKRDIWLMVKILLKSN